MPVNFDMLKQFSGIFPTNTGSHYTLFVFPVINTTAHQKKKGKLQLPDFNTLTLSNPIFLPTAYSPALICFGR
jgi:hypothetical protein